MDGKPESRCAMGLRGEREQWQDNVRKLEAYLCIPCTGSKFVLYNPDTLTEQSFYRRIIIIFTLEEHTLSQCYF